MPANVKKSTASIIRRKSNPVIKVKAQAEERPRKKKSVPQDLEQRIRERAYQLYVDRGYTGGDERQDWIEAERLVKKELGLA